MHPHLIEFCETISHPALIDGDAPKDKVSMDMRHNYLYHPINGEMSRVEDLYFQAPNSKYLYQLRQELERSAQSIVPLIEKLVYEDCDDVHIEWISLRNTLAALKQSVSSRSMLITRDSSFSRACTIDVNSVRHPRVMAIDVAQGWIEVMDEKTTLTAMIEAYPDSSVRRLDESPRWGIRRIQGAFTSIAFNFKPQE